MPGTASPKGLTLIELVVALGLAAVLLVAAASGFRGLLLDNRETALINRFRLALATARTAAVTGGREVVLCRRAGGNSLACANSPGDWGDGWLIFADPNDDADCTDGDNDYACDADGGRLVEAVANPVGDMSDLTLTGNANVDKSVSFDDQGYASGNPGTFLLCRRSTSSKRGALVLSMAGRVRYVDADENPSGSCP